MLTLNADRLPLMNRMHKPDLKRPLLVQDKRSVMPIALANVDSWRFATIEDASSLLKLPEVESIVAGPAK